MSTTTAAPPFKELFPDATDAAEFQRTRDHDCFRTLQIDSAEELLKKLNSPPFDRRSWIFRGQMDASWHLQPTIERVVEQNPVMPVSAFEDYINREFRRLARNFISNTPRDENRLEWLALMRHYGAPTRLLDWSRSPFVALFFALADAQSPQASAIWCLDGFALQTRAAYMLREGGMPLKMEYFEAGYVRYISERDRPAIVISTEPHGVNERLAMQQGLFLVSNHVPFEQALTHMLFPYRDRIDDGLDKAVAIKVIIPFHVRQQILYGLERMNIGWASLLPGLDGFARSLDTVCKITGCGQP
jgi:hypothetical protein